MNWEKLFSDERIQQTTRTKDDGRNEFESDYGRVIFSPAIRRMHDKTQVIPLSTDDNIHTRLTHSLEAMSIAYTIGIKLSANDTFQNITKKKRGVFQSEKDFLEKIATACELYNGDFIKRHPFAYLVEAADTICYLVMDIEDGFNKKWYSIDDVYSIFDKSEENLEHSQNLRAIKTQIEKKDPQNDTLKIIKFRLYCINFLTDLAIKNFLTNIEDIYKGSFNYELIEYGDGCHFEKALREFNKNKIFTQREILQQELAGDAVIKGLLQILTDCLCFSEHDYKKRIKGIISDSLKTVAKLEDDVNTINDLNDYTKLRLIVDYVSGMTDQFALTLYQKLNGNRL